jgi:ribose transport system permease protein
VSSPSPASNPGSGPAQSLRPWWHRVVFAQEFGLVAVIALMAVGLWLFTPTINTTDRTPLVGATVAAAGEGAFTVTHQGAAKTYRESDGYSYRATDDRVILIQQAKVSKFLNTNNLVSVLTSSAFIAIMAVGMTGIIIKGGIDLSVGSIYALAIVFGAMAIEPLIGTMNEPMADSAGPLVAIVVVLAVCVGTGAVCGLVNGVGTVGLGVHPFIVTLGGMAVYRGIAFVCTKGQTIGPFPADFTGSFGKLPLFGTTPVPLILMALVGVAGAVVLTSTVFGRRTFAIGGNEVAARYAGIPVGRTKVSLFVIMGALAGLAAALYVGYYGAGGPDAGKGYELNVIAAAVVGGASLSGGRGTALGAVLGAIVIQLIDNSILMLGIDQNYKEIVIGAAIVLAVVIDQTKQRLTGR